MLDLKPKFQLHSPVNQVNSDALLAQDKTLLNRPPTLADLGKVLGLSKRAVSQALHDRPGTVKVSEATRARVQTLAKQMGYRQNQAAAALSTGRTGLFGILFPIGRMHVSGVRAAMAFETFTDLGIFPLVISSKPGASTAEQMLSAILSARLDGLLIVDRHSMLTPDFFSELKRFGTRVVQAGSTAATPGVRHFLADRTQAIHLLVDHLVDEGYRHLGAMVGPGTNQASDVLPTMASSGTQTRLALLEAVNSKRNSGCDLRLDLFEPEPTDEIDIHPLYSDAYRCMKGIIARNEVPEALLCQVDGWAFGAMRACSESGLRIPHDVAMTGYSNEPVSSVGVVPLTTIEEPFAELVHKAVHELVSAVKSNIDLPPKATFMESRLIIRKSSLKSHRI